MGADDADRPGVVARPPLIYLGFLVLGLGLGYVWPAPFMGDVARYALGLPLIGLGVAAMAMALRQFRRAGTSVQTAKPTTVIVTGGLYRHSRNPIYVGMALIYAGLGVAAENPWVLALLVPLLMVIRYGVIAREERYLETKFGEEYSRYKERTRRWL